MVPWRLLKTFVKGYEFSDEKIGSVFGFDGLAEAQKVDGCVMAALRTALDDEAYEALAVARRVGHEGKKGVFVLVLDDDDDEEKLREGPLPKPLHWSLERMMILLDGPHVYKPIG